MKRIAAAYLAILLLLSGSAALAAPAESAAAVTINGIRTAFFSEDGRYLPPLEQDGVLYVPALSLADSLGLSVTADADTSAVRLDGVRMAFFGEDGAFLPPLILDGTVYVPLLAFAESAGIRAEKSGNGVALYTGRIGETRAEAPAATPEPADNYWLKLDRDNFRTYFEIDADESKNLRQSGMTASGTIRVTLTCTALKSYEYRDVRFSVTVSVADSYLFFSGLTMPRSGILTGEKTVRVSGINAMYIAWSSAFVESVDGISGEIRIPRAELQAQYEEADRAEREGDLNKALRLLALPARIGFGDAAARVKAIENRRREEALAAEAREREETYGKALAGMASGNYEEAVRLLEPLAADAYKDSAEQLQAAREAVKEQKYQAALALLDGEKYDEAVRAFQALGTYRDSPDRVLAAREAIKERKYQVALALLDEEKYDEAIRAFQALGTYRDSPGRVLAAREAVKEQKYQAALILLDAKKYEEAIRAFKALGDYRDSPSQLAAAQEAHNEQLYLEASGLFRDGLFGEAARLFSSLGAYRDSAGRAETAREWIAGHIREVKGFKALSFHGFRGGFAAVQYKNGKWGFINTEGKLVVSCQFDEVSGFLDGYACVTVGTGDSRKKGLIDPTGKRVVPVGQYEDIGTYNCGLSRIRSGGLYGFIDLNVELAIPCVYEDANFFIDGLAMVKKNGLWGAVDTTGRLVVLPQFTELFPFREGVSINKEDSRYWYIDTDGQKLFGRSFIKAYLFSDGLALCAETYDNAKKAWAYQYIDHTGKAVITLCDPKYRNLYDFHNGYAIINVDNQLGIIDHTGAMTVPAVYTSIVYDTAPEEKVYYAAKKDGKWGIIDAQGRVIEPFEYDLARPYFDGFGLALKGETLYVLRLPDAD